MNAPDDEWAEAYQELVVERFDRDMALLLLRLMEQPGLLKDALDFFAQSVSEEESGDGETTTQ